MVEREKRNSQLALLEPGGGWGSPSHWGPLASAAESCKHAGSNKTLSGQRAGKMRNFASKMGQGRVLGLGEALSAMELVSAIDCMRSSAQDGGQTICTLCQKKAKKNSCRIPGFHNR